MKLEVDLTCPHCRERVHVVYHETSVDSTKDCPRCGSPIPYPSSELKKTEEAMGELEKGLGELAKLGNLKI